MKVKTAGMSLNLAWISVSDFDRAVKYYTETLGLELLECNEGWGWAELRGADGAIFGIGRAQNDMKAESNATPCFSVEDLEDKLEELEEKGVTFVGEVVEIPGHVKMQLCQDEDGNQYHLTQMLD